MLTTWHLISAKPLSTLGVARVPAGTPVPRVGDGLMFRNRDYTVVEVHWDLNSTDYQPGLGNDDDYVPRFQDNPPLITITLKADSP